MQGVTWQKHLRCVAPTLAIIQLHQRCATGAIAICDWSLTDSSTSEEGGLTDLKMESPLLATKGNDWVPTPQTEGRNAVEHSKRSAGLCGWAVVKNGTLRGRKEIGDHIVSSRRGCE